METQNFKTLINSLLNSEMISFNCGFGNTGLKGGISESVAACSLLTPDRGPPRRPLDLLSL